MPRIAYASNGHYDLLIIAHEDFLEPLRELAEWKTRTGMPTRVESWQGYNRSYAGWDAPERIKHGIKLMHENFGVKYVMLVGDSDMFPVRYTMTDRRANDSTPGGQRFGYGAYYASDLYYADLYKQDGSFDDWDYNDNHLFGELHGEWFVNHPINMDQIDMIPDVAVGRLPAATRQEVENYVEKVIEYETNTRGETRVGSTREWFKSALFIIPYTPNDTLDTTFKAAKENIASYYLTSERGFQIIRLYDPRVCTTTNGTPRQDLIKWWLTYGVGFVNFGGHGNRDHWEYVFSTWTVDSPTFYNTKLPIATSLGCGTAQFAVQPPYESYIDINGHSHSGINLGELWPTSLTLPQPASIQADIQDSFPEHMLCYHADKGAIAYYGCITGAQAWSKYLDEFFYQGYNETVKLGDMWINAVTKYCDTSKTIDRTTLGSIGRGETRIKANGDWFKVAGYHQPMKFLLFGDPSLRVGGLTNRPPLADIPSPDDITITEGTPYTFDSADWGFRDPEGTPLTYRWDFNGDGTWDTGWTSSPRTSHTYNDNTRCSVKVQASDGQYQSNICTRRVTVLNVAPILYVDPSGILPGGTGPPPCYRVKEGKQVRFEPYIDDPGSDTFTYSWNFGNGATPQTSTERYPIVTFAGPEVSGFVLDSVIRTYYVTLLVRDDDGGIGTYRLTMEVVHPGFIDRIRDLLFSNMGITGITIVAISAAVMAAVMGILIWRMRLRGRGGREPQRPI